MKIFIFSTIPSQFSEVPTKRVSS